MECVYILLVFRLRNLYISYCITEYLSYIYPTLIEIRWVEYGADYLRNMRFFA